MHTQIRIENFEGVVGAQLQLNYLIVKRQPEGA